MAGSRAQTRQRTHEKARAEQQLFTDVADAFHLLLQQRQDLAALETTRTLLTQRLEELNERQRLGRSRPTEVVSAEAHLRRVEAEMEDVRRQELTGRHLLEFLTGLDRVNAVADEDPSLPTVEDAAVYVAKLDARPDVQAQYEAWRAATKEVVVARAGFWPTVDLEGNYYTQRAGAAADVTWDATLKVDVPLFEGGRNVGALRQAAARARQAKLQYEQARRAAELEIRNAYENVSSALARLNALERVLEASETQYRLQAEDYGRSLVSNLDVLQSLQELQDARRDVIAARHNAKRLYWQLRVAVGETL